MAGVPPETGLNFSLPWGVIEWVLTGITAAGGLVAGWVWRLGTKVSGLESQVRHLEDQNEMLNEMIVELKGEHRQTQQIMRSFGGELDRKMQEQIEKLEHRIDGVSEKVDKVRHELPSTSFIEGQLTALSLRLDNSIAFRLAGRGD